MITELDILLRKDSEEKLRFGGHVLKRDSNWLIVSPAEHLGAWSGWRNIRNLSSSLSISFVLFKHFDWISVD